jgi:hypothetical protein
MADEKLATAKAKSEADQAEKQAQTARAAEANERARRIRAEYDGGCSLL